MDKRALDALFALQDAFGFVSWTVEDDRLKMQVKITPEEAEFLAQGRVMFS